jgi:hypothetical protein
MTNQVCSEAGACVAPTVTPDPEPPSDTGPEPTTESADERQSTDEPDPEPSAPDDASAVESGPSDEAARDTEDVASAGDDVARASDVDPPPPRVYASGNGCAAGDDALGGFVAAIAICVWGAGRRRRNRTPDGRLPAGDRAIRRTATRRP